MNEIQKTALKHISYSHGLFLCSGGLSKEWLFKTCIWPNFLFSCEKPQTLFEVELEKETV